MIPSIEQKGNSWLAGAGDGGDLVPYLLACFHRMAQPPHPQLGGIYADETQIAMLEPINGQEVAMETPPATHGRPCSVFTPQWERAKGRGG